MHKFDSSQELVKHCSERVRSDSVADDKQAVLFGICSSVLLCASARTWLHSWPKNSHFISIVSVFSCVVCWNALSSDSAEARSGAEGAHQQMERDGHGWTRSQDITQGFGPEQSAFYERLVLMCLCAGASVRHWCILHQFNTSLNQIYDFHVCFSNRYLSREGFLRDWARLCNIRKVNSVLSGCWFWISLFTKV